MIALQLQIPSRGRDISCLIPPRTEPYVRSRAHTALILNRWQQSEARDKDGARTVQGAIVPPVYGFESTRVEGADIVMQSLDLTCRAAGRNLCAVFAYPKDISAFSVGDCEGLPRLNCDDS
jgi:hypothetical protein